MWKRYTSSSRSIFDSPEEEFDPDEEAKRHQVYIASNAIRLLEEITIERAIASNTVLMQQREEIAARILASEPGQADESDLARWDQYYATLRAVVCGASWSPVRLMDRWGE